MAKPSPDRVQAAGEERLTAWGIVPDAGVEALVAVLHREVAADVAIAHRLGAIATAASAEALQALEHAATDKSVRREAKRARYRLQQRGVAAAETPPAAPAGPLLSAPIEALISALDGRGDQLVWLLKPQPGGALHLFAVINDPAGLREVALHTVTRKALKALRAELEARHDVTLAPVDWAYADFLVRRAFDWARARGTRMEGDYPGARAQFSSRPAPAEAPAMAAIAHDAAALAASGELLAEPELRTWVRPIDEMQPALDALTAARDSPLVLNEAQQHERFDAAIHAAVETVFGGEHRVVWARRLAEQARYFAATRRPERAAQAAAAAAALAGAAALREVPFCQHLVRASLALYVEMAMAQEREAAQGALVVSPQQAARLRER